MLMISLCGRRGYWLRSYFAIKSIHEKGKAKKYLVVLQGALLAAAHFAPMITRVIAVLLVLVSLAVPQIQGQSSSPEAEVRRTLADFVARTSERAH